MRVVTRMADRLLELIAPHSVARAADCDWECCRGYGSARYCCYYPNGSSSCGSCQSYWRCA
ncbi:hypothetical protein AB0K16_59185 [Nonomuraea jabiensis]|uniref:Uncharacterized protein n=1 Tax=Nonomuraea jabiensis TaxID=882448 RepID=A0A7W9G3S4_9ACTN|nr:hypothetical protein [Nonomuraea jabiensis]MBB5776641.1 hypothetical protein [Nonomuraea jabiensis]